MMGMDGLGPWAMLLGGLMTLLLWGGLVVLAIGRLQAESRVLLLSRR